MLLTLDVSKLSGWLNADACCRVETGSYITGPGEVWAGRGDRAWGVGATQPTSTERPRLKAGDGIRVRVRAHPKHAAHVRDAGRVPTGYVRVDILQLVEKVAHVGDG
eukprot:scaffold120833_cov60-Phaeocystis_antarctica.AAC.1